MIIAILLVIYILGAMIAAGACMEASSTAAQSGVPLTHRIYAAILAGAIWPGSALRAIGKAIRRK